MSYRFPVAALELGKIVDEKKKTVFSVGKHDAELVNMISTISLVTVLPDGFKKFRPK